MSKQRIICFDGGGIKGLFTTTLLGRVAKVRPDIFKKADLFAGTSTGGIIALGLAHGLSPAELSKLYYEKAQKIFDDSFWDDLLDLGKSIGADYSNKNLKHELKILFGGTTLGELKQKVLIPTFDLMTEADKENPTRWSPKFFHNYPGDDSDAPEKVIDVALRTSAAPTYFPAHQGYIDGGVVANNPSMAALVQALDAERGPGCALKDISLLSVSTGSEPKFIKGERLDWGWGEWARPLISIMISGVMGVADHQCKLLLDDRYHRLDANLDRPYQMDNVKKDGLDYLIAAANAVDIEGTIVWLDKNW